MRFTRRSGLIPATGAHETRAAEEFRRVVRAYQWQRHFFAALVRLKRSSGILPPDGWLVLQCRKSSGVLSRLYNSAGRIPLARAESPLSSGRREARFFAWVFAGVRVPTRCHLPDEVSG